MPGPYFVRFTPSRTFFRLTLAHVRAGGGVGSRPPFDGSSPAGFRAPGPFVVVPPSSRKGGARKAARATAPAIELEPAIGRAPVTELEDPPSSPDGGGSPEKRAGSSRDRLPSQSRSPPSERTRSPPATSQRVAELERMLAAEEERIRQLFAQQLAEPHEDVSC
jgi:hypothetical protein